MFSRRREISPHSFRKQLYSKKALPPGIEREGDSVPPELTRFRSFPLTPHGDIPPIPTTDSLTIILSGGWRIVVGAGFDPETPRSLG